MLRGLRWMLAFAVLALPGCGGGSPSQPTPPAPPVPALTCPANVETVARMGQPAFVTFQTPQPVGGAIPVTTVCTPASGSSFLLGSTTVTCTATDSLGRPGTCTFAVVVNAAPQLSRARYLAFGDSITAGTTSPEPTILTVSPPDSYPFKLQELLAARYIDQTILVENAGLGGERVVEAGEERLEGALQAFRPEVLLLLHGANDLLAGQDSAIGSIVRALRNMVVYTKDQGVHVLLATHPPQNPNGSRGRGANSVSKLNAEIVRLAAEQSVPVVDLYNGLDGTWVGSIGVDGLHPTPAGYTKIAQIWFDAVQREFERTTGASLTGGVAGRPGVSGRQ